MSQIGAIIMINNMTEEDNHAHDLDLIRGTSERKIAEKIEEEAGNLRAAEMITEAKAAQKNLREALEARINILIAVKLRLSKTRQRIEMIFVLEKSGSETCQRT